jgi:hypothetical protein
MMDGLAPENSPELRGSRPVPEGVARGGGQQAGDPAKIGRALVTLADHEQPPLRFGADAVAVVEQKAADLKEQVEAHRELSMSLALDELELAGNAR